MTTSPFDAQLPSTWLTNCADPSTWLQSPTREGCWLQSSLVHPHDNDQEDAWSQNPTVHIYNNFFRKDELGQNFVSGHNLLEQTILKAWATCVLFLRPLKQFFICLGLGEKKSQRYIHGFQDFVLLLSLYSHPLTLPHSFYPISKSLSSKSLYIVIKLGTSVYIVKPMHTTPCTSCGLLTLINCNH